MAHSKTVVVAIVKCIAYVLGLITGLAQLCVEVEDRKECDLTWMQYFHLLHILD